MGQVQPNASKKRQQREQRQALLKKCLSYKTGAALLAIGLLFGVLAGVLSWWQQLDSKPIRAYALLGKPQYTRNEDIRRALAQLPTPMTSYFSQDVLPIEQVVHRLPWVEAVWVHKLWSDKLSIQVKEYRPVVRWNEADFLNANGVVFSLPKDAKLPEGLPQLGGPNARAKEVLDYWKKWKNSLASQKIYIKGLEINPIGGWQLFLSNGIQLNLGVNSNTADFDKKITRFKAIYPLIEVPEGKRIEYIDLRYNNGLSVRFR